MQSINKKPILSFTSSSIYCPAANVHIDPWKAVDYAIITHAHSDHAKFGSRHYLAHKDSESILRLRLGDTISLQTVEYNESFVINGVKFSLHPAGHIIGSAQIRVEYNGEVWVASGDYKLQNDNFSAPYENVRCNTFITESTFGLPIYRWQAQQKVFEEIHEWILQNEINGKTSVLMGYSLGKMQRIVKNLPSEINFYAHGAVFNVNETLRKAGYDLPAMKLVTRETKKDSLKNSVVLAPSSILNTPWMKKFEPYSTGYCSGWMAIRGAKNRKSIDRGFVLSDHADWDELNFAVRETGAEKVFVTHGYTDDFSRWLNENGIQSEEVKTNYGDTEEELQAESKQETL